MKESHKRWRALQKQSPAACFMPYLHLAQLVCGHTSDTAGVKPSDPCTRRVLQRSRQPASVAQAVSLRNAH